MRPILLFLTMLLNPTIFAATEGEYLEYINRANSVCGPESHCLRSQCISLGRAKLNLVLQFFNGSSRLTKGLQMALAEHMSKVGSADRDLQKVAERHADLLMQRLAGKNVETALLEVESSLARTKSEFDRANDAFNAIGELTMATGNPLHKMIGAPDEQMQVRQVMRKLSVEYVSYKVMEDVIELGRRQHNLDNISRAEADVASNALTLPAKDFLGSDAFLQTVWPEKIYDRRTNFSDQIGIVIGNSGIQLEKMVTVSFLDQRVAGAEQPKPVMKVEFMYGSKKVASAVLTGFKVAKIEVDMQDNGQNNFIDLAQNKKTAAEIFEIIEISLSKNISPNNEIKIGRIFKDKI